MELLEKLGAAVVQPMMVRAYLGKADLIELSPHQLVVMYICIYVYVCMMYVDYWVTY